MLILDDIPVQAKTGSAFIKWKKLNSIDKDSG